jgi:hypothetical protein
MSSTVKPKPQSESEIARAIYPHLVKDAAPAKPTPREAVDKFLREAEQRAKRRT